MKFQRYLNERFYNATIDTEIFVNPDKGEMRDLRISSWEDGVRFVLDTKTKTVYVWSGRVLHAHIFEKFKTLIKGFNFDSYYKTGKYADHVFTGNIDKYDNINSDTWFGDFRRNPNEDMLKNMKKFSKKDISWASKYLDTKKLNELVLRAIELIEEKL